MVNITM